METHEFDNKIKRALCSKADEMLPSEDTFTQILAGLNKKQVRKTFKASVNQYFIVLICAVSVILGTLLIQPGAVKDSAVTLINSVKTMLILDKSEKVLDKDADGKFNPFKANNQSGMDNSKRESEGVSYLQSLAGFSLQQGNELELFFRLLIISRMTYVQTWYDNKFWRRQVLAY